jgi:hypothetical protein
LTNIKVIEQVQIKSGIYLLETKHKGKIISIPKSHCTAERTA